MHKAGFVVYVDNFGKEHDALVRAQNGQHPGFIDLAYVDEKADERDNLVTVYGVAHMNHESKQDTRTTKVSDPNSNTTVVDGNPNLPHYDLHCWKERDQEHNALPADHPAFDNPFKLPEKDQDGNIIPIPRPEFEKEIAEHLASKAPSAANLDADAEEQKAKEATAPEKPAKGASWGRKNGK